jgi:hypothetical protein
VWLLADSTQSGTGSLDLSLNYTYNGSGSAWGGPGGSGTNGWDSNGHWESTAHIYQQSHSKEQLDTATTWSASGEPTTTGTDERSVSATGTADSSDSSWWHDQLWYNGNVTSGWGGSFDNATHDDYDYTNPGR